MDEDKKLYTTAEIMLATGYPRGTVTSRMKRMELEGIPIRITMNRNGKWGVEIYDD